MAVIILVVVLAVGLLAVGFLAPRFSRRMQGRMDRGAERAESKADSKPQPVRSASEGPLKLSQRIADGATEAGRRGRDETRQAGS